MAKQTSPKVSTKAGRYLRMIRDGGFVAWIKNRTDAELETFADEFGSICASNLSQDTTKGQIQDGASHYGPPGRQT